MTVIERIPAVVELNLNLAYARVADIRSAVEVYYGTARRFFGAS